MGLFMKSDAIDEGKMKILRKVADGLNSISLVFEKISNFICIVCLTLQICTIGVVVVGRYFFSKVPMGTEELALLCMVWIAMLSMSLCIRDDSHMRMDLIDMFVKKDKIEYFQILCGMILIIFNILMIKYGFKLFKMKINSRMSSLPISGAWFYAPLPLAGVLNTVAALAFMLNHIVSIVEKKGCEK